MTMEAMSYSLRQTVLGILKTLIVSASQNNLNLTYNVKPDIPDRLIGDSLQLRQVIMNLVGNTIKFMPFKVLCPTPSVLPFNPTPPCSQPKPSDSQLLSCQLTTSSVETASCSLLFNLNDPRDDGDGQLHRILAMAKEIVDQCHICWVHKEVTCPYRTFHCPTGICSGNEWKTFRSNVPFPPGVVCYFCFAPYSPPFNHTRALPGTKQAPDVCEYPDILKELLYILYQDQLLRGKIFARLGVAPPLTLYNYKKYIAKA
jgi:hypothetical protein